MRKPTAVDVDIGKKLRDRRMALGLDSREVARQIGVSHQQLVKYERGLSRLTSGSVSKISSLLGVPLSFLFGGADLLGAPESAGSKEVLALRAFVSTEEGQELNHAFLRIGESKIRRHYLALVCAVAGLQAQDADKGSALMPVGAQPSQARIRTRLP